MKDLKNKKQNIGGSKVDDKKYEELKKQIESLALAIDKVEDEKLLLKNQLVKALADYQNLESSMLKRQEIKFFQMKKSLSESFMSVLDSMKLSIESEQTLKLDDKEKAWFEGVEAIFAEFERALSGIGLEIYLPKKGDMFDSTIHDALATVDGGKAGEIMEVIQPGYTLDGTVIRDAKVIVSK